MLGSNNRFARCGKITPEYREVFRMKQLDKFSSEEEKEAKTLELKRMAPLIKKKAFSELNFSEDVFDALKVVKRGGRPRKDSHRQHNFKVRLVDALRALSGDEFPQEAKRKGPVPKYKDFDPMERK